MKSLRIRILLTSFLLIFGTFALLTGCGSKETDMVTPPTLNFFTSFTEAAQAAAADDKPFMVKFYTDWCTWCKVQDTTTLVDSAVISFLNGTFAFARVNAEVDTATAKMYSVGGYPTIVIFDSKGTEIDRIVGHMPPEEFMETVNNYLNGIGTLEYYLAMADSAGTGEVYFAVADKYNDRGKSDEARIYYEKVINADPENKDGFTDQSMISLGNILRRNGDYDGAIKQFGEIIRRFKDNEVAADAEIWTAIAYRQKGDTAKAIQWFEGFVKNHPESSDTAYALAQIEKLKNPPPPEEK
jgi:tetratricopeptide (TPR) repeat protein